ncbi:efflux RND transporter periplasmic adaptor subunit [Flavobacterium granuli]|uniref:RND family efflux transporter MFP subunit n=1 Tax=Flavobacterium granuli TaxID=280093 RepID=A0ABU1S2R2_9FLAO|nr:efflux RND transporter periplasmic adaptor subunit [Flavobacterium granuli]MDR6845316.1 RND family efflux transporter MFP subunit [Flavobacterium granuli]
MKKILILTTLSIVLIACNSSEKNQSFEAIIASKDVKAITAKKAELQLQLTQIDEALATLDVNKEVEALVTAVKLKDTTFNHYLEIQGNINTNENVLIQPEFPGNLVELNVKAGQKVSKGQVLGRTDDGGMSQQLASAENQYALAKTTFERQKNLWNQKIGSEIQYLQAQTQMISAQKAVAQIKAQIAKTVIKAPFSGTIDELFVEKGEVVSASPQGLMRIVNLGNMYVSTSIPETYIGKLKIGTEVDVYLSSLGKTYKGKVRQIGNFINPNNRSFGIEVSVPNPDNLLRPNQVAKLKVIDYVSKNAVVVPTNVIQQDATKNSFVYTVDNSTGKTGIAKKVIVKTGQSSDNVTEILSGLDADAIIVTEGMNTISDGMKLNF